MVVTPTPEADTTTAVTPVIYEDADVSISSKIVTTGQTTFYDKDGNIIATGEEADVEYYGQDAFYESLDFDFTDNGNGTVTDNNTGLTWEADPRDEQISWSDAQVYCDYLNEIAYGGYTDWRMPSTTELFSLSDFSVGWPYIDLDYFSINFTENAGGPVGGTSDVATSTPDGVYVLDDGTTISKDAQYWSSDLYVVDESYGALQGMAFGVNHATGHIKAYDTADNGIMGKFFRAVRGEEYGVNQFVDNNDATVTDYGTGLMWATADLGYAMDWQTAITVAEETEIGGYSDWRLPDVKELQSLVDYSGTYPAIDSEFFTCTELEENEFYYYWTSTSAYFSPDEDENGYAWYVGFGLTVDDDGNDLHGAGGVRFSPKYVESDFVGEGGDNMLNSVRLVRDVTPRLSIDEASTIAEEIHESVGYEAAVGGYPIVDTNQTAFYGNEGEIDEPQPGEAFYGQDAHYEGNQPSYTDNGDGTISDNVTGLMWQQDPGEKLLWYEAVERMEYYNEISYLGYSDWRIPTIKELYSINDFSGYTNIDPYLDTDYFVFTYGLDDREPRNIDSQALTTSIYDSTTLAGNTTVFGFNFADGRIKGYGVDQEEFYCYMVRGNTSYGLNLFEDNGDDTITDLATGLMWMQYDSGYYEAGVASDGTMDWEEALAWAQQANEEEYLGYSDWRLPNAKELQSLVDYDYGPATTDSAAIDPLFYCTPIVNFYGWEDYGFYWSSTTHGEGSYTDAIYVVFGYAMGVWEGEIVDVHGAGAQRSDPKTGDREDYPIANPMAPQGDELRVFNMVRLVRDADVTVEDETLEYMVTQIEDAVAYEPAGHYDVTPLRLHSDSDLDGYITAGLSTFEIGGYADMAVTTAEMLYYIVEGEMTITTDDGEVHVLQTGDSIHFGVGVGREPVNTNDGQTKMLVVSCAGIEGATEGLYKVVYAEDAVEYEAVGHYDVTPTRLHNPDDVEGALMVGLSHFDPGGGADMADAPAEMIYFIVDGEMTITTGDGEVHVLQNDDSIRFMTGTGREPVNTYSDITQMLVISCTLGG